MRWIYLPLAFAATPAATWEFTPGLPCLLTHEEPGLEVTLTHDPTQPLYSITITRQAPWAAGDVFSIAFGNGPTISTNRQEISDEGRSLTVSDRGFGNVIAGIAAGGTATATLGADSVSFSLADAAEPAFDYAACEPVAFASLTPPSHWAVWPHG
ncbi:MAG: hypothetical protein AAGI10_13945 [Pseudomonadota bacterium]